MEAVILWLCKNLLVAPDQVDDHTPIRMGIAKWTHPVINSINKGKDNENLSMRWGKGH